MTEFYDGKATERGISAAAGVILCGGVAARMGGEKALVPFAEGTLLDAVLARVLRQVSNLALNVPRAGAERYASRYPNYPMLFDVYHDRRGPLSGAIAGLEWAQQLSDTGWLAPFPCD